MVDWNKPNWFAVDEERVIIAAVDKQSNGRFRFRLRKDEDDLTLEDIKRLRGLFVDICACHGVDTITEEDLAHGYYEEWQEEYLV